MRRRALIGSLAMIGVSACSWGYDDRPHRIGFISEPDPSYRGAEWTGMRGPYEGELHGPGVEILDDWLKETREGRAVVTLGFREAGAGMVSEDVAHRANIWFRRYADRDRDMIVTDPEIRTALVAAAGRYLRASEGPDNRSR